MIDHVFMRMGSQFREGAILHAKFVVTSGPVYSAKSTRPGSFHNRLVLAKDVSTGFLKLTVTGGAREIALVSAIHVNVASPTDPTLFLQIRPYVAIDEAGGVVKLKCVNGASTEAFADPAVTDEIHITLYVAK